ncbi:hypothetical protein HDU97_007193 [Phlyctochytrium planicorne]|nr:hypothetical protein HDU97_007193 [Phlyctochytrium planicorne]
MSSPHHHQHHESYKTTDDDESPSLKYQQPPQTDRRRIVTIVVLTVIGISTVSVLWSSFKPVSSNLHAASLDPNKAQDFTKLICSPVSPEPAKVAVCMAGAARTLKYPVVYKTIKNNVIDALGADVKLFGYLKMQDPATDKDAWVAWPDPTKTSEDELKEAMSVLKPETIKYTYESNPIEENPNCAFAATTWFYNKTARIQRALGQFNALSECFKLVEEYENKNAMKFDMVLRIRPDAAYLYPIPPWCAYSPDKIYAPAIYFDHFNLMHRRHASAVFGMIKYYKEQCNETVTAYNPELFLRSRIVAVTKNKVQQYPFGLHIVREAGPEIKYTLCHQLGGYIGDMDRCKLLLETQQNRS